MILHDLKIFTEGQLYDNNSPNLPCAKRGSIRIKSTIVGIVRMMKFNYIPFVDF